MTLRATGVERRHCAPCDQETLQITYTKKGRSARWRCSRCGSPKRPTPHRKRILSRMPKALGTHRERVKYANELWRHLIYAKSPDGRCVRCQCRPFGNAAHIFPKKPHPALRFELTNGAPLCVPCHRTIDGEHEVKREWAIQYLGKEEYGRLHLMSQARSKVDVALVILHLEQLTGEQ